MRLANFCRVGGVSGRSSLSILFPISLDNTPYHHHTPLMKHLHDILVTLFLVLVFGCLLTLVLCLYLKSTGWL